MSSDGQAYGLAGKKDDWGLKIINCHRKEREEEEEEEEEEEDSVG